MYHALIQYNIMLEYILTFNILFSFTFLIAFYRTALSYVVLCAVILFAFHIKSNSRNVVYYTSLLCLTMHSIMLSYILLYQLMVYHIFCWVLVVYVIFFPFYCVVLHCNLLRFMLMQI